MKQKMSHKMDARCNVRMAVSFTALVRFLRSTAGSGGVFLRFGIHSFYQEFKDGAALNMYLPVPLQCLCPCLCRRRQEDSRHGLAARSSQPRATAVVEATADGWTLAVQQRPFQH